MREDRQTRTVQCELLWRESSSRCWAYVSLRPRIGDWQMLPLTDARRNSEGWEEIRQEARRRKKTRVAGEELLRLNDMSTQSQSW